MLPPGIVGLPFFESSAWWFIGVYADEGIRWKRLYSRGPIWLTQAQADAEMVDTAESFWGRSVFLWKWVGTWRLESRIG